LGENTADIAQQDLDESLRTINEYMEEQNVDFETRENAADIEHQDLDGNLRTIDENMKESISCPSISSSIVLKLS
jgi:hypothetical protein